MGLCHIYFLRVYLAVYLLISEGYTVQAPPKNVGKYVSDHVCIVLFWFPFNDSLLWALIFIYFDLLLASHRSALQIIFFSDFRYFTKLWKINLKQFMFFSGKFFNVIWALAPSSFCWVGVWLFLVWAGIFLR